MTNTATSQTGKINIGCQIKFQLDPYDKFYAITTADTSTKATDTSMKLGNVKVGRIREHVCFPFGELLQLMVARLIDCTNSLCN